MRFLRSPFALGALAALLIGIAHAASRYWVCDDAFISFRYVQQLFAGHGLVYNPGERVEGYTHPLWLWLLIGARALGGDHVEASKVLGLVFHAGTIVVLAACSLALFRSRRPFLPMAALAFSVHRDAAIWATGGLETSLFTFLAILLVYVSAPGRRGGGGRPLLAGTVGALIALTRLDGLIFAGAAGLLVTKRHGARGGALYALPLIALLVPYSIWRLQYYGSLLPNPYYAKSAGIPYYDQGLRYIELYLKAYPSTLLLPLGLATWGALALSKRTRGRAAEALPEEAGCGDMLRLTAAMILAYVGLFVARVGGDFMFARFLIPVVPLIALALESVLRHLLASRRGVLAASMLIVPLLVGAEGLLRDRLFRDSQGGNATRHDGIGDEHWYYTHRDGGRSLIETYRWIGVHLAPYFEGTEVRVLVGGQASLGYYARFAFCVEECGLTDREIARLPLAARGRPGHEKVAPFDLLVRRGVHFEFMKRPHRDEDYRLATFQVGERRIRAEILTYDGDLMEHLARRFPGQVAFVDFPRYLDDYLAHARGKPAAAIRADYEAFRDFYFLHNDDPEREARFQALPAVAAASPSLPR